MHKWRTIILLFLPAAVGAAQTLVDLSRQSKTIDFSQATHTKPAQAGNGSPSQACSAGEVFFQLDAAAGQNLYLCAPANTWNQLTGTGSGSGGGGGGGTPVTSTSALTDLRVNFDAGTPAALSVGGGCTNAAPCRVRFGAHTVQVIPVTFTITQVVNNFAGGMVYIFVSSADAKITAYSTFSNATVTCAPAGSCNVITTGPAQFPADSVPIASWTSATTNGQWDPNGGTDMRSFISTVNPLVAGTGISFDTAPGQILIKADTSVVAVRVAPPAAANSTCVRGNYAVDTQFFYQCANTDTWLRVAMSTWP